MSENLINDLLDLAKMDHQEFQFTKEYFNLPAIIYQSFDMILSTANEKEIALTAEVDRQTNLDLFHAVYGDKRRYT